MDINQTTIAAINQASRATFRRNYDAYTPLTPRLAMTTPAPAGFAIYAWLGSMPAMKPFKNRLEKQTVASSDWTVKNEEFAMSWDIKRLEIKRDQFGVYTPQFAMAGANASIHPDQLAFGLLTTGFAQKDYTGKNFFDTDKLHVKGSKATFSNKSDKKLTLASYNAGRASLLNVKDPSGLPWNIAPKLALVVGPENLGAAEQILNATDIGGTTNTAKGTAELIMSPLITGPEWFLLNLGGPARPLVWQPEIDTEFTSLTDPKSPNVFHEEVFSYKAYGVYTVNYGLPQLAYGSLGTQN